jgi:2-polyprenyl-3-methyl-5-hydroxy-6-metoxy-1,4-benzoquinol methylase
MHNDRSNKLTHCPVCDSLVRYGFTKLGREFHVCSSCGLGFINPPPEPDEIKNIYDRSYYDSWGIDGDDASTEMMKQATFHDKLAVIEKEMPDKGRILDIGCATGFFLDVARQRGWETYGVELSSYSAAIAAGKIGADRIFNGQVEDACFAEGFFDAVVMTDVIEHVTDVRAFIAEVARILRPGGVAAITTPNPLSLSCRLLGRHWPHYKLEHLLYLTPQALSLLMRPLGFKRLQLTAATKTLTFSYLELQMRTYPVPVLSPLVAGFSRLLPDSAKNLNFRIFSGELFDIARLEKKPLS